MWGGEIEEVMKLWLLVVKLASSRMVEGVEERGVIKGDLIDVCVLLLRAVEEGVVEGQVRRGEGGIEGRNEGWS